MKVGIDFIKSLCSKLKKENKPSEIEERMVRREAQDTIEIGRTLEGMYNSSAGSILRALVNGRISLEAQQHREGGPIEPARALGRIEAYQMILDDIELAIAQYYSLIKPLPENEAQEDDKNENRQNDDRGLHRRQGQV